MFEVFYFILKTNVGAGKGSVGIDAVLVCPVDKVKEHVAERLLGGSLVGQGRQGGCFLLVSKDGLDSYAGGFLLQAHGFDKRGQTGGNPFED